MRPGEAVMELSRLGFRFRLDGDSVKLRFEGNQTPDPASVSLLLDLVRQHKEDVRTFLRGFCPKCEGMCFGTFSDGEERCVNCYYQALKALNPGLELKH